MSQSSSSSVLKRQLPILAFSVALYFLYGLVANIIVGRLNRGLGNLHGEWSLRYDGRGLLRLKYLDKATIGTLEKIEGFVSSKVYCRLCILYACAKLSQGSRVLVLIFVNKIFVIGKSLTKITKIILLEIFQLYSSFRIFNWTVNWALHFIVI